MEDGSCDSTAGIAMVERDLWEAGYGFVLWSDGDVAGVDGYEGTGGEGRDGDCVADCGAETAAFEGEWC